MWTTSAVSTLGSERSFASAASAVIPTGSVSVAIPVSPAETGLFQASARPRLRESAPSAFSPAPGFNCTAISSGCIHSTPFGVGQSWGDIGGLCATDARQVSRIGSAASASPQAVSQRNTAEPDFSRIAHLFLHNAARRLPLLHLRQPVRMLADDVLIAVAPLPGHLVEERCPARVHRIFRIAELIQPVLLDHLVNPLFLLLI